jgi:hypothetical protein
MGVRRETHTSHEGAAITWEWGENSYQLRTTTAEFSALQRSTMDTSDKWFTLDHRGGPIWGQRVASSNLASPTKLLKASDQMRLNQSDRDLVSNRDLHCN